MKIVDEYAALVPWNSPFAPRDGQGDVSYCPDATSRRMSTLALTSATHVLRQSKAELRDGAGRVLNTPSAATLSCAPRGLLLLDRFQPGSER